MTSALSPTSLPSRRTQPSDPGSQNLFGAILHLNNVDEVSMFFRDLCTRTELRDMSQRWEVAQLLDQGLTYREVAERSGVSTATITRINEWLQNGTGGYRLLLDRIDSQKRNSKPNQKERPAQLPGPKRNNKQ